MHFPLLLCTDFASFSRRNSHDPDFKTKVKVAYRKRSGQQIKVSVFDEDDGGKKPQMKEKDRMGSAVVKLDELVAQQAGTEQKFVLSHDADKKRNKKLADSGSFVLLTCSSSGEAAEVRCVLFFLAIVPRVSICFFVLYPCMALCQFRYTCCTATTWKLLCCTAMLMLCVSSASPSYCAGSRTRSRKVQGQSCEIHPANHCQVKCGLGARRNFPCGVDVCFRQ